jgi:hypothetical protein
MEANKFLLEIMTLVSSANIMGSGKVLTGGRSFICIMKSKGLRIDVGGTPCFIFSQFEQTF